MIDVQFHSLLPELLVAIRFADRAAQSQHGRVRRHDEDRQLMRRRLLHQHAVVLPHVQLFLREC